MTNEVKGRLHFSKELLQEIINDDQRKAQIFRLILRKTKFDPKYKNFFLDQLIDIEDRRGIIEAQPTDKDLLPIEIGRVAFNVTEYLLHKYPRYTKLNQAEYYVFVQELADKCRQRLVKSFQHLPKTPLRSEIYFRILDFLEESDSEFRNLKDNYNPKRWDFSGVGFDGKYVENIVIVVTEQVERSLEFEEEENYDSKFENVVDKTKSRFYDSYLRKIEKHIFEGKDLFYDPYDWDQARKLVDYIISLVDNKLNRNAQNPFLSPKPVDKVSSIASEGSPRKKTWKKHSLGEKIDHFIRGYLSFYRKPENKHKKLTNTYLAKKSSISDSTWNRFFGVSGSKLELVVKLINDRITDRLNSNIHDSQESRNLLEHLKTDCYTFFNIREVGHSELKLKEKLVASPDKISTSKKKNVSHDKTESEDDQAGVKDDLSENEQTYDPQSEYDDLSL